MKNLTTKTNMFTFISGGITTILAGAGYSELGDKVYMVLLIIGASLGVISLCITISEKIITAIKTKKFDKQTADDLAKSFKDLGDKVKQAADDVKKAGDDTKGDNDNGNS